MTTLAISTAATFQARTRTRIAASSDGSRFEQYLQNSLKHYAWARLQPVSQALVSLIWEREQQSGSADEARIAPSVVPHALAFASLIPAGYPHPEIAADPDGEVSFDWLGRSERILSVSVGPNGRLAFAARFSDDERLSGALPLKDEFPRIILQALQRVTAA